jgi:transcriptional regulator with XRE-family HTH domain
MSKTPAQAKVGQWMRETREYLRMSQKEFAQHLRRNAPFVTASFVAKTELGERRLDVTEFVAISKALGAAPRKMFDRLMEYLE